MWTHIKTLPPLLTLGLLLVSCTSSQPPYHEPAKQVAYDFLDQFPHKQVGYTIYYRAVFMANMNGEPLDPNLKPEDLLSASIDSDGEPDESVFFQHWFQQIGVSFQDPKTYVRFPVHPSYVMRLSDRSYPFYCLPN